MKCSLDRYKICLLRLSQRDDANAKRRKTCAIELRMVLVLLMIGRKSVASFIRQSCSAVDAKPIIF